MHENPPYLKPGCFPYVSATVKMWSDRVILQSSKVPTYEANMRSRLLKQTVDMKRVR